MPIIHLQHARIINYAKTEDLTPIPEDLIRLYQDAQIISFRKAITRQSVQTINNVHACFRYPEITHGTDVVCVGLQTDSPLSPLLFWDIAHTLSVGNTITLYEWDGLPSYLENEYFKNSLIVETRSENMLVLKKVSPLIAEQDRGLEQWTFAIPVGPDDGILLNAVVERILQLDIPEKEILLCGRPSNEFRYFDQVRIIGEDITAPPVRICLKKNRLAQEAKYPNLCILHSRVYLPLQFMQAIQKFGDDFPITAFQCLYFDDQYNFIPRRYSDYGVMNSTHYANDVVTNPQDPETNWSQFNRNTLYYLERSSFCYAHPLLFSENRYITGSLYICKRHVWLSCPQNEALNWSEFEDVEFGVRAQKYGIPSRINPYAITQSMISRPLLSLCGYIHSEHASYHNYKECRSFFERLPFIRKPMIKIAQEQSLTNLYKFQQKYVPVDLHSKLDMSMVNNNKKRIKIIIQLIYSSQLPIRSCDFINYIKDYEKWLIGDSLTFNFIHDLEKKLINQNNDIRYELLANNIFLANQLAMRPKKNIFCSSEADYLLNKTKLVKFGSFISALLIWRKRKSLIYIEGNPLSIYKLILNSTPFRNRG